MRHVPKSEGKRFTLYDIILNILGPDEAVEGEAWVAGRFLMVKRPRSADDDGIEDAHRFDFFRDDTFEESSTAKVNTRIRVFGILEPERFMDYYAHMSSLDFLILSWKFDKTWVQQKDNFMWLTNAILTIASVCIAALALKISLTPPQPLTLDKQQIQELIHELRASRIERLDTLATKKINQPNAPTRLSQEADSSTGAKSRQARSSSTRTPTQ